MVTPEWKTQVRDAMRSVIDIEYPTDAVPSMIDLMDYITRLAEGSEYCGEPQLLTIDEWRMMNNRVLWP